MASANDENGIAVRNIRTDMMTAKNLVCFFIFYSYDFEILFFCRCCVYMNIISQKIFPVKPGTKSSLVFAVSHVFDASMYRLRDVEGYLAIFCFVMFFRQNEP